MDRARLPGADSVPVGPPTRASLFAEKARRAVFICQSASGNSRWRLKMLSSFSKTKLTGNGSRTGLRVALSQGDRASERFLPGRAARNRISPGRRNPIRHNRLERGKHCVCRYLGIVCVGAAIPESRGPLPLLNFTPVAELVKDRSMEGR